MLSLLHMVSKIGYLAIGIVYPVYCTYSLVSSSNIEWTQFSQLRQLLQQQQQQREESEQQENNNDSSENMVINVDPERMEMWLTYWVCFSLMLLFDYFFGVILSVSFTFYDEFRFLVILFLLLPQTKGSTKIYNRFFAPPLTFNERFIDENMEAVSKQLYASVLQYLVLARDESMRFVKDQVQKYLFDPENSILRSITNSVGDGSGHNNNDDDSSNTK